MDWEPQDFEGLPAVTAMYFAVLEQSGCMGMLHDLEAEVWRGVGAPCRKLGMAQAFKACTGTFFTSGVRMPLYHVKYLYENSPTDLLFGPHVEVRSLSDTVLAQRLEELAALDTDELTYGFGRRIEGFFGLGSDDYVLDNTDVDFDGRPREAAAKGVAVMRYSGKCKSGRTGVLHKEVMKCCTADGVEVYSHVHDGATADAEMDLDAVRFLIEKLDPDRCILSGDCKFCDARILSLLDQRGFGFVTKVPENFSDHIRDACTSSAAERFLDESAEHPGRFTYETHSVVSDSAGNAIGDFRLVVFRLPGGVRRAERYLRTRGLREAEKALARVWHRRFDTREQCVEAVFEALEETEGVYRAVLDYDFDRRLGGWMVRVRGVEADGDLLAEAARRRSLQVLVTNIPFSDEDRRVRRTGMTADSVVGRYLSQCVIERRFRMEKTCYGMSHVYIHTPARQDAMIVMCNMASSVQSAMDARLEASRPKGGAKMTVERLADMLANGRLEYVRGSNMIRFSGSAASLALFREAVERLGINISYAFTN